LEHGQAAEALAEVKAAASALLSALLTASALALAVWEEASGASEEASAVLASASVSCSSEKGLTNFNDSDL
jgi:hypothetical protein